MSSAHGVWDRWWLLALDAVFPPRCVGPRCGARGEWLCAKCRAAIAHPSAPCRACGLPLEGGALCAACRARPRPWRAFASGGLFRPPLSSAIRELKYKGRPALAHPLALVAAAAWAASVPDGCVSPAAGETSPRCLVPVPADPLRSRRRGLDHTRAIAAALAPLVGFKPAWGALARTRTTRPQVGLAAAERRANVADSFHATPLPAPRVLLVDDVMTTGATLEAAAHALVAAGATEVAVCVVARALPPRGRGHAPDGFV